MQLWSDAGLLLALATGAIANFVGTALLCRVLQRGLLTPIVGGFAAGAAIVASYLLQVFGSTSFTLVDSLGIVATVFIIYGAAGFFLFALANLGETSLRIRMLYLLAQNPDGLTLAEIGRYYNDDELGDTRLRRMVAHGLIDVVDGTVYPRLGFSGLLLLLVSRVLWFWKRVLYGRPNASSAITRPPP